MRRVVVTGLGTINPLGNNVENSWNSLINSKSGISKITKFIVDNYPCKIAGSIDDKEINSDIVRLRDQRKIDRFITLGLIAAGFPPAQAAVLATDPNFNPLIALQGLQLLPQFTNFPNAAQDGKSSDDNVDYTFKLSYEVSDTVTVYGGVSTGFKASAWNISRNSDADA